MISTSLSKAFQRFRQNQRAFIKKDLIGLDNCIKTLRKKGHAEPFNPDD